MSDAVYKHVNIIGSSSDSIEGAIEGAIAKASNSLNNLSWFEVSEIRGTSVTARWTTTRWA